MTPTSFSWVTAFLGPVSDFLIASIFFYGALFSRFRVAFALIGVGGVFFFFSHLFWLAVTLRLLSKDSFALLFPFQAASLYLGVAVAVAGDMMLVWQITRPHETQNT